MNNQFAHSWAQFQRLDKNCHAFQRLSCFPNKCFWILNDEDLWRCQKWLWRGIWCQFHGPQDRFGEHFAKLLWQSNEEGLSLHYSQCLSVKEIKENVFLFQFTESVLSPLNMKWFCPDDHVFPIAFPKWSDFHFLWFQCPMDGWRSVD